MCADRATACNYLYSWRSGIWKKSCTVVLVGWVRFGFFSTNWGSFDLLSVPADAVCKCCVVAFQLQFFRFSCWHVSARSRRHAQLTDMWHTWKDMRSFICCLDAACEFALFLLVSRRRRRLFISQPLFDIVITVDFRVLVPIHY